MVKDAEVLLAQAKQRCAVDLGIAADPIAGAGMQRVSFLVPPFLFRVIAVVEKDVGGAPIRFFLWQE